VSNLELHVDPKAGIFFKYIDEIFILIVGTALFILKVINREKFSNIKISAVLFLISVAEHVFLLKNGIGLTFLFIYHCSDGSFL